MGTCHGSKKASNEKLIDDIDNLEIFSLIWLDRTRRKSHKISSLQQQFRTIINYMKIFSNEIDCENFIKQMSNEECIILIIDDQIDEKFLLNIHSLEQIFSIYIYSSNKNFDQPWISQFDKIKSICTNSTELFNQIQIDQTKCEYIQNPILFDIFDSKKSPELNNQFFYSQILINVLLQMDSIPDDMNNLISLIRNQYKGNKNQLNLLREFEKTYSCDTAIWWLTRNIFLSEIFSKALKTQNLDLIFLFRFFLHDIEQQLDQNQSLKPIKVYKYQLLSNEQFNLFKDSIGQYVSINNFLLTTIKRDPSPKGLLNNTNSQSILFEITADPNVEQINSFADITTLKYLQTTETEILFMLGSIFHIDHIDQSDNDLWIIQLTLTSRMNEELKSFFDQFKTENSTIDDLNLLSFGYILQKMNKIPETENYYHRLFNELPDDDERISSCCLNLGNLAFLKTDYVTSREWLLKSLHHALQTFEPENSFLASIYNSLGYVYHAENNSQLAIESYNKAIIIWKQSVDENYLHLAECMNNIGIIYKEDKDYHLALQCFEKTAFILEKYLPKEHFDLSKIYCNLASTYRQVTDYDSALDYYNLSFQILEKHYSIDHPNIAKALGNLGIVYALKGEREKALLYYGKAAEIYRQTLPPTHVNNLKIEQLIRNVSSPNRKVSFGPIVSN